MHGRAGYQHRQTTRSRGDSTLSIGAAKRTSRNNLAGKVARFARHRPPNIVSAANDDPFTRV